MRPRPKVCSAEKVDPKFKLGPCAGPLWICRNYYGRGQHDYRCERHAKQGMQMNPLGAQYSPQRG
jgi:hypothetical protein